MSKTDAKNVKPRYGRPIRASFSLRFFLGLNVSAEHLEDKELLKEILAQNALDQLQAMDLNPREVADIVEDIELTDDADGGMQAGVPIPVVFRVWKGENHGDVIALFPTLPYDIHGRECMSYMHVGQHGGADYFGVIQKTRPAKPADYAPLLKELKEIGYSLRVVRCETKAHREARHAAAQEIEA